MKSKAGRFDRKGEKREREGKHGEEKYGGHATVTMTESVEREDKGFCVVTKDS